jgi:hypothetical protein
LVERVVTAHEIHLDSLIHQGNPVCQNAQSGR